MSHSLLLCHILTFVLSLVLIFLSDCTVVTQLILKMSVIIPVTSTAACQKVEERLKKQL